MQIFCTFAPVFEDHGILSDLERCSLMRKIWKFEYKSYEKINH